MTAAADKDRSEAIGRIERIYAEADRRAREAPQERLYPLSREAEAVLEDLVFLLRRSPNQRPLVGALRQIAAKAAVNEVRDTDVQKNGEN